MTDETTPIPDATTPIPDPAPAPAPAPSNPGRIHDLIAEIENAIGNAEKRFNLFVISKIHDDIKKVLQEVKTLV